jgi:hypothetical protein
MVKRTRTRRGKKRRTNILKRTAFKTIKNLKNINSKLIKKINLFNLLKKTKRRKHKHRGGG